MKTAGVIVRNCRASRTDGNAMSRRCQFGREVDVGGMAASPSRVLRVLWAGPLLLVALWSDVALAGYRHYALDQLPVTPNAEMADYVCVAATIALFYVWGAYLDDSSSTKKGVFRAAMAAIGVLGLAMLPRILRLANLSV